MPCQNVSSTGPVAVASASVGQSGNVSSSAAVVVGAMVVSSGGSVSPTGSVSPGASVTGGGCVDCVTTRLPAGGDDRVARTARHGDQRGGRQTGEAPHPFTAPAVSPRTNWRWNAISTTKIGSEAITVPAVTRLSLSMSPIFRCSSPIWIVRWASSVMIA